MPQAAPVLGPTKCELTSQWLLLCESCDANHPLVVKECGAATLLEAVFDRDCVGEWLRGRQLAGRESSCFCFQTDPFPADEYPEKQPNERRFFHYTNITKVLGVKGKRAKLPKWERLQQRKASLLAGDTAQDLCDEKEGPGRIRGNKSTHPARAPVDPTDLEQELNI